MAAITDFTHPIGRPELPTVISESKTRPNIMNKAVPFLLLILNPAIADVQISSSDAAYSVSTPTYQATISRKTGMLERLTIDGTNTIEKTTVGLENRPFEKIDVIQESATKVVTYITAKEKDGKLVEKALRISYEAEDSILYLKILSTVGRVSGRGPYFHLNKDVQMVRSLEYKESLPMPALIGRTPWMRVKFYYANGATLGILNQGAGNPFNPNENGGVFGYQYSRGGYVANSEYVYTLVAEKGTKKTCGSPPIAIAETQTPAVFWQGEPIAATLTLKQEHYARLAGLKGLKIKYEIQDVFEKTVAEGDLPLDISSGKDITLKAPLPVTKLGWYRALFTVNDATGGLLEGKERLIFSVLKRQANMGESFENQVKTDYTIGLGLMRVGVNPAKPEEAEGLVRQYVEKAKGTDVNISYAIDGSPEGNDPKRFGEVCRQLFERVKDNIPRIEIINEPNGTLQPKEYVDTFLRPAYDNIKKASSNSKVVAPVMCGIGPDQARYLKELYQLGLKNLTDELSFHPYAGNFDDGNGVESMQRLMDIINANGDSKKPIHFTEAGYGHRGWSDVPTLREIIKFAVSQYAWQNAVMGITYQQNFYYFTDQMGYYDMWLRSTQLTPAAVALRTHTGFVKGQQQARRLDFGSLTAVRAFIYPGTERQVVVLWTVGNYVPAGAPDPSSEVMFKVTATNIQHFDHYGNPLPVEVKQGDLKLTVGTYPTYLVLPAQATIRTVPEQWGANVALAAGGAIAESSSEEGTQPAISAIDGNTASESSWRSLTPNELPQSLTVMLSGMAPIDRVGIWGYSPRGYDLEAMGADGRWKTLVTKRDQPYQRFRTETFKTIVTEGVRLTVVDSTTDRVAIAELEVYSPSAKSGEVVELVNWALKTNGATATASSQMEKEVTIAEQDWGAKKPRLTQIKLEAKAENAIDGKRMIKDWREFFPTTWMAKANVEADQWLEITFPEPRKLTSIAVYTIAFANWTPANSGIRDWDIELWNNGWKKLDSIRDNERVSRITRLKEPTLTEKIRIVVKGTNDPRGTMGIMEVEAFGMK